MSAKEQQMESAPRLYKVISADGSPLHGGTGQWSLPVDGRPGEWMPTVERVRVCLSGYHLTSSPPSWLKPRCRIFLAEGRGASEAEGSKTAYASARLLREVTLGDWDLRLFAADCAEHVLHFYEAKFPKDDRPRKAIEAARKYARGELTAAAAADADAADADAAAADAAAAAADAAATAEREWQRERWEWYVNQAYPEAKA